MMKHYKIFTYLSVLLVSLALSSCEDKFDYSGGVVGEGEALVDATLTFKTNVTNLGSRSSGTAISTIDNLHIVIYNADENEGEDKPATLYKLINNVDFKFSGNNGDTPTGYPTESDTDEEGNIIEGTEHDKTTEYSTQKVEVTGLVLPYGKYYIYAVANLGRALTVDEVSTIEKLKSIECEWNFAPMQYQYDPDKEVGPTNPQGTQINAQMFGCFTKLDNPESRNKVGSAFDESDPVVIINQPSVSLHCWVKRLASKVTIAYDGHNLRDGVYVYIHNVSIRQIPYKCYLGKNNDPKGENSVTPAYFDNSIPEDRKSQVLYYNEDGSIGDYSQYNPTEKNSENWMRVTKGVASDTDHPGIVGAYNHTNSDPALFFYENMKGVHPKNPKPQQPNEVGSFVGPKDDDYQDDIEYGTFIEVEAYYKCDIVPVSQGPIRYRFMLGQNIDDDYNAIRNSHYKLTLGFKGYANQPDWHIEYEPKVPEINAPVVFIPYIYNTAVKYPITITGDPTSVDVELIENNWGPWDYDKNKVPDRAYGSNDTDNRTLRFEWWKEIYDNEMGFKTEGIPLNSQGRIQANYSTNPTTGYNQDETRNYSNLSSNYLYGRHRSVKKLDAEGKLRTTSGDDDYYYVTPIWAGFLRLLQPTNFVKVMNVPATLYPETGDADSFRSNEQLNRFRDYYYSCPDSKDAGKNLGKRTFNLAKEDDPNNLNENLNAYNVIRELDADGKTKSVSIEMNLWTQPKSMCGISGFSGNNPYEDYTRKAVLRITAHYPGSNGEEEVIMKDVTVYQTERLVNPKAVWRSHELQTYDDGTVDNVFNVILYKKNTNSPNGGEFEEVESKGAWRAEIITGNKEFISIGAKGNTVVTGSTGSNIKFPILFNGNIKYDESRCAIIEITYHGNTCVHNIYVRQGFHQPLQIDPNGTYWSSYNVYSCGSSSDIYYSPNLEEVEATLTYNPIAFGSYFKRGNYYQAISEANVTNTAFGFGPLGNPGSNPFKITDRPNTSLAWSGISGISGNGNNNWHWANTFKVTQDVVTDGITNSITRKYRVPTIDDYEKLRNQDFGIGVMYGNGAKEPARTTLGAYGFLDEDNKTLMSPRGIRGIICYNQTNANQIFFPIGTMGIGRRTIQTEYWQSVHYGLGSLRYGALPTNYTIDNNTQWGSTGTVNALRPITYNISNASGSIYWAYERANGHSPGWDMNYSDLNFNQYDDGITLDKNGEHGDALPIRLVIDNP